MCPGASDASRKRRRENHGAHGGSAHKELTQREEKALVSDAQALLDDLESMLDGGAPSASSVKTAGDHVGGAGGAWAPPSTRSNSAGDADPQSDDDELERLLDHESDDQGATQVELSDNGDLDADDEEAVDEELDLY